MIKEHGASQWWSSRRATVTIAKADAAMWKPPQKLAFQSGPGRVPTRELARRSRLFSPIAVGAVRLKQRTWVPAMVPWRATQDGLVTDDVIDWYARFARGRPGAIVVEATGIQEIPSGPLLRIGHDRFVPGLRALSMRLKPPVAVIPGS